MEQIDFFQRYMPGDVCFGCGGDNPYGLRIQSFWEGDECVCLWTPRKKHQGWPGMTCGGIIATLVDCHCMASAMAIAVRNENRSLGSIPQYRFATGTLSVRYNKPTPIDVPITLKAKAVAVRENRIYTLTCDIFSAKKKTAEAEVVAFQVYKSSGSSDVDCGPFDPDTGKL